MKKHHQIKIGLADYGLNVWEGDCYDLEERLQKVKDLGFAGIEKLEAQDSADLIRRAALFRRMGMHFSTCYAADPQTLIQWVAATGKDYAWIPSRAGSRQTSLETYYSRCNLFLQACRRWNVTGSLHNHLGARIETQQELEDFLGACPDAGLILDTGHLHMAGGDVREIVRKYHHRLSTLHMKDVFLTGGKDEWGRDRYRFCELGAGNSGLDHAMVIEELMRVEWTGWMHIEHDQHLRDPLIDLRESLELIQNILGK